MICKIKDFILGLFKKNAPQAGQKEETTATTKQDVPVRRPRRSTAPSPEKKKAAVRAKSRRQAKDD